MPLPTLYPGAPPPTFIPAPVAADDGGTIQGLAPTAAMGVCVAFNDSTLVATPYWQRLDDPAGPWTVQSWNVDRGRSYELDKTGPGTATVTLVDRTGDFDPTRAGGPFAGKLQPMKQACIALQNPVTAAWTMIYRGFVADWAYDMDVTEDFLYVTLELVDAFDLLAAAECVPGEFGSPAPTISTGNVYYPAHDQVKSRIDAALDDANWPIGLRDVFSGNVSVQETTYAPRSEVLTVIQDAADAEFPGVANVYVGKDGKVVFHGRFPRFRPAVVEYGVDTWYCGDVAAVAASPTTVAPISTLAFNRGKTNLINAALSTPQGITDEFIASQYVQDTTSVSTYGVRSVSFENLLTNRGYVDVPNSTSVVETKKYGSYYKSNYKDPRTRVSRVTFRPVNPSGSSGAALWALMCGIEISDILHVKTTHPGGGGFDEDFYVEGIHYQAKPMNATHPEVTLEVDVSPKAYYTTEPA